MARNTPKGTSDLVLHMKRLQEGDEKHKAVKAVPKEIRTRVNDALTRLDTALSHVQAAKAGYHTAAQMAHEAVREARKASSAITKSVYALYEDSDKTVEDYGLTTRAVPKPRAKKEAPKSGEPTNA